VEKRQKTNFVPKVTPPSIIIEKEVIKFPLRTVSDVATNLEKDTKVLAENTVQVSAPLCIKQTLW
jgi:hypothetical protein